MNFVIPIHPDEVDLPRSHIELATEGGDDTIVFHNLPIQGQKTLRMLLETLNIWKPALVRPDAPDLEFEI